MPTANDVFFSDASVVGKFNEFGNRARSFSVLYITDSNGVNQYGFSNGISRGFEAYGINKIASAPTIGSYINNQSGRAEFRNESHISVTTANQGNYSLAAAGHRAYFPYSTDGPTNTAIQAVIDNEPAYARHVGNMGTPYVSINQSATPTVGHDIFSRFNVYVPYVEGPSLGSRNGWTRSTAGAGYFNTAYVDSGLVNHAAASFAVRTGFWGSMNGGTPGTAVRGGDTAFEILPFGATWPHTPEVSVLSAFITYPNRPHGYCIGPATIQGGTGIHDHEAFYEGVQTQLIDSWLIISATALEGRTGDILVWITLGQNNRTAPNDTKAVYRSGLDAILDTIDTRFAALKAAGTIAANCQNVICISDVNGFRLPTSPESLDHCYAASREKGESRGLMVVPDYRNMLTAAQAAAICSDGAHLNTTADYETRGIANWVRIMESARSASGGFRSRISRNFRAR